MHKKLDKDSTIHPTSTQPWFLYMLECVDGSIYTGIAVDVAARYAQHQAGKGARYTRAYPPKKILLTFELPDHSAALQAEALIKNLSPTAKKMLIALLPLCNR